MGITLVKKYIIDAFTSNQNAGIILPLPVNILYGINHELFTASIFKNSGLQFNKKINRRNSKLFSWLISSNFEFSMRRQLLRLPLHKQKPG